MKYKHIHFVGIKGVGMAPLAIIAKEAGCRVSGCDIAEEFITDNALAKARIVPTEGFAKEHLKNIDLVITTGAHGGLDNEEVQFAKEMKIPILTQGQAVGEFMKGEIFSRKFEGISIAGTHGKTTTTAMFATILTNCGQDPSYIIGTSEISSLPLPGHFGKGQYFIAEADEYATEPNYDTTPKFLWQHPKIAIFTNIDLDHPDIYPSIDALRDAFTKFASNVSTNGTLIVNGDDRQLKKIQQSFTGRVITFGYSAANDFILEKVSISTPKTFFWVRAKTMSLGEFSLNVLGEHNALNALGAIVAAIECGLSIESIRKSLPRFTGSKRRFEFVGRLATGAYLYDDYAHHPTEIVTTLKAYKQSFPKAKLVCIFQPHTYSRTKKLFEQFLRSFTDAETVILTNIYPSLREQPDPTISSKLLADQMSHFHKHVLFLPKLTDVVEYIDQNSFRKDTIIITMGAGDIYKISKKLKVAVQS